MWNLENTSKKHRTTNSFQIYFVIPKLTGIPRFPVVKNIPLGSN